jgi:putative two-component system response regulator
MSPDKKKSILVVDDDPYVLESSSTLLSEYEYSVVSCGCGEDALNLLLKNDVVLILTDIQMPGMTGIELLGKIHAIYPKMPVVLMTGYAELDMAIDAIKKGAFDFITKPYNADHLLHTIDKAVRYAELLNMEDEYKQKLEETVREQTQEIFNLSREVINRLTAVAEFRDTGTGAHIARLGLYANKIAEALNMPVYFIDSITYACSLHDIGKIGIPDNILLKPGKLTDEEFHTIKGHTTIGNNILSGSTNATLKMGASIALNHHERMDGTGYPRGLKGKEIPIEGRIAIICDQYDALMSMRPYKPSLTHAETFEIITQGDGRTLPEHFDADILSVFKDLALVFKEIYVEHQD